MIGRFDLFLIYYRIMAHRVSLHLSIEKLIFLKALQIDNLIRCKWNRITNIFWQKTMCLLLYLSSKLVETRRVKSQLHSHHKLQFIPYGDKTPGCDKVEQERVLLLDHSTFCERSTVISYLKVTCNVHWAT